VYQHRKVRHVRRDEDTVENVRLNKGMNVLVFKVVNEAADWKACVRFVDQDGKPVQGLRVSITPEPLAQGEAPREKRARSGNRC
jgi:hypothetical protein